MIFLNLFITFLKIGAFTFGGGYAMIPIIRTEVLANDWLTHEELLNFLAVSESTPGPFSVNLSTYVGVRTAGLPGAFFATLGLVLPSFVIILIISSLFFRYRSNKFVTGALSGLKPAVVGLIGAAVISLGSSVFFPDGLTTDNFLKWNVLASAVICGGCVILSLKKLNPVIIIAISAGAGLLCAFIPGVRL